MEKINMTGALSANFRVPTILKAIFFSFLCFPAVLVGKNAFPYDFEFYHSPLFDLINTNFLKSGFLQFDPYVYSGVSFTENSQSMQYYPLFIALVMFNKIFQIENPLYTYQFLNIIHFAIGFLGFYRILQSDEQDQVITLCLAISAAYCGTWLANAQHAGIIAALSFFPWLIYCFRYLYVRHYSNFIALSAIIMYLMISAGFIPLIVNVLFIWFLFIANYIFDMMNLKFNHINVTIRVFCIISVCVILVLFSSAVIFIPLIFADLKNTSLSTHGSIPIARWLTFFSPDALNSFNISNYINFANITKTYHYSNTLLFLFFGFVVLKSKYLYFIFVLIVISLSQNIFEISKFIQIIPGGNLYRPALFDLFVVPMMAIGLAGCRQAELRKTALIALPIYVTIIITLLYHTIAVKSIQVDSKLIVVQSLFGLAILGLIALTSRKVVINCALIASTAVPFLHNAYRPNQMWMSLSTPDSFSANTVERGFGDLISILRSGQEPHRVAVDQRVLGGPWNGAWRTWRIESVNGFEPNIDRSYFEYMTTDFAQWHTNRTFGDFSPDSEKFESFNVRYYLTTAQGDTAFRDHASWRIVYDQFFRVYERLPFSPRFRLATHCGGDDRIEIVRRSLGRYVIVVNTECEKNDLILSERPHKNWQVTKGSGVVSWTPVERAIGMRIPIEKGNYKLTIQFRSPYFIYSIILTMLALTCLVVVIVVPKVRRKIDGFVENLLVPVSPEIPARRPGS